MMNKKVLNVEEINQVNGGIIGVMYHKFYLIKDSEESCLEVYPFTEEGLLKVYNRANETGISTRIKFYDNMWPEDL